MLAVTVGIAFQHHGLHVVEQHCGHTAQIVKSQQQESRTDSKDSSGTKVTNVMRLYPSVATKADMGIWPGARPRNQPATAVRSVSKRTTAADTLERGFPDSGRWQAARWGGPARPVAADKIQMAPVCGAWFTGWYRATDGSRR
uniref:Uncharacterized protein n=1 Tax=Klebsiella pneumoniae TaxID=573 RepID=A0A2P1BPR7_KLEPN|nr:hypothetical protein [Klebsiella pneumoniae]